MQLVDARLQTFVLVHQRVADQHARHAGIFLGKRQQHGGDGVGLLQPAVLFRADLVDQAEHRLLDEADQSLVHLRLAGEVAVERGFGYVEPGGEGCRGDFLALRGLQHLGQDLQDLVLALTGAGRHDRLIAYADVRRF